MKKQNNIIIIGTGPAALMAGTRLIERGFVVHFYEQKKAAGRKFLVAGHGGFNLSNSIDKERFLSMYNRAEIRRMVAAFDAEDLIAFLKKIDIPTYIGSSGKLFPAPHIKPIDVLKSWLDYLKVNGAVFHYEHELLDFNDAKLFFQFKGEKIEVDYYKLVLALGGASWAKTGSTGTWWDLFHSKNIQVVPFEASNAGFNIPLPDTLSVYEGVPIKHVNCTLGSQSRYGEIVLTKYGFEGAPIFYLNGAFREGNSELHIDTKPGFDVDKIKSILSDAKNPTEGLKQLKISKGGKTNNQIVTIYKKC